MGCMSMHAQLEKRSQNISWKYIKRIRKQKEGTKSNDNKNYMQFLDF